MLIGVISREIISSCHTLLDPHSIVAFADSQVSMCQPHHWSEITMVTAVSKKMNRNSSIKTTTTTIIAKKTLESINGSISSASGFRLLIEANGGLGNIMYAGGSGSMGLEMCETMSSISKNSVYKQRIDAMFDDSRWVLNQNKFEFTEIETDLVLNRMKTWKIFNCFMVTF